MQSSTEAPSYLAKLNNALVAFERLNPAPSVSPTFKARDLLSTFKARDLLSIADTLVRLLGPCTTPALAAALSTRIHQGLQLHQRRRELDDLSPRIIEILDYDLEPYKSDDEDDDDEGGGDAEGEGEGDETTTQQKKQQRQQKQQKQADRSSATSIRARLRIATDEWAVLLRLARKLPKTTSRSTAQIRLRMQLALAGITNTVAAQDDDDEDEDEAKMAMAMEMETDMGTDMDTAEAGVAADVGLDTLAADTLAGAESDAALRLLKRFIFMPSKAGGDGKSKLRNLDRTVRELRRAVAAARETAVAADKRRK